MKLLILLAAFTAHVAATTRSLLITRELDTIAQRTRHTFMGPLAIRQTLHRRGDKPSGKPPSNPSSSKERSPPRARTPLMQGTRGTHKLSRHRDRRPSFGSLPEEQGITVPYPAHTYPGIPGPPGYPRPTYQSRESDARALVTKKGGPGTTIGATRHPASSFLMPTQFRDQPRATASDSRVVGASLGLENDGKTKLIATGKTVVGAASAAGNGRVVMKSYGSGGLDTKILQESDGPTIMRAGRSTPGKQASVEIKTHGLAGAHVIASKHVNDDLGCQTCRGHAVLEDWTAAKTGL